MRRGLLVLVFLLLPTLSHAATINTAWNANTEADLNGYNEYIAPGPCTNPGAFAKAGMFVKTATTGAVTVVADGTYCLKLTAFDTSNNESVFSNSVEAVVNTNFPPVAPVNHRVISVVP